MRLALVQRLIARLLGRESGLPGPANASIVTALRMDGGS